ncbi:hypothetical protein ABH923_001614 [Leifsonia sp. EB41]|uniref:hypothetical protein n=1 Tax=Leifsonia sp. EB41 TaxID=3156260 RepID=UPI0035196141
MANEFAVAVAQPQASSEVVSRAGGRGEIVGDVTRQLDDALTRRNGGASVRLAVVDDEIERGEERFGDTIHDPGLSGAHDPRAAVSRQARVSHVIKT